MIRFYYKLLGGHYHIRCFCKGKMGDLVCGEREFEALREAMPGVTFIEEV